MPFRLGLVGLCTSHPEKWVPIIRRVSDEKRLDIEVVAAWDSGQTRPEGFAVEFCRKHGVPTAAGDLHEMVGLVDGVIVHTANWDCHVAHARPSVEADKPVLIDKPLVGNLRDARELLQWVKQDKRVTGGSALRFALEVQEYLARPLSERGQLDTAYAGCGTDEFFYGIHAYALLAGLLGPGLRSVQYLGATRQKLLKLNWSNNTVGLLSVGKAEKLPFHLTAVASKTVTQIIVDPKSIYRALLEACLPYLAGRVEGPPLSMKDLLEPELAALAAKKSWCDGGSQVVLADLRQDDPDYGTLW